MDEVAAAVLEIVGDLMGCGGTWGFERPHDLTDATGEVVPAMELASAALLGATVLSLRLPSAGTGLAGGAPAGLVMMIGGQGYALAADTRAVGELLPVTITAPGLLASAAVGVVVTLADSARFNVANCVRQDDRARWSAGMAVVGAEYELVVPKLNAPSGFTPRAGDILVNPAGPDSMVMIVPHDGGGAWAVYAGNTAGYSGAGA